MPFTRPGTIQDGVDNASGETYINPIYDFLEAIDTDDVAEGSNLYFTTARAQAAASAQVVDDLTTGGTTVPSSAEQAKVLSETIRDRQLLDADKPDILRKHTVSASGYSSVSVPNNASGGVEAVLSGNSATNTAEDTWATSLDGWISSYDSIVDGKYRITHTTDAGGARYINDQIDASKYYFVSVLGTSNSDTDGALFKIQKYGIGTLKESTTLAATQTARIGCILQPSDLTGVTDFGLSCYNKGSGYAEFSEFEIIEITADEYAEGLTAIMQKYPYFSNGTQNAGPQRLVSLSEDEETESVAYVPAPGNSLPNGTADEIDLLTGKKTQNVQEYALTADDFSGLSTAYTNLDVLSISRNNFTDWILYGTPTNLRTTGSTYISGFTDTLTLTMDSADNIGKNLVQYTQKNILSLGIPKGTYADLAAAQAALAGTVIYYQLATHVETDVHIRGRKDFKLYPSGTVYTEPSLWGYLTAATTIITTSDRPIKSIRKVVRFDVSNGEITETDVTAYASTSDNLSLTISGYDSTKTYFYDCEYDTQYSTNPGIDLECEVNGGVVSHDYGAAAADWTLTDNESKAKYFSLTNAGGAANMIIVPESGTEKIVNNTSGYTVTVKASGGTGVTVTTGTIAHVLYSGYDYVTI